MAETDENKANIKKKCHLFKSRSKFGRKFELRSENEF